MLRTTLSHRQQQQSRDETERICYGRGIVLIFVTCVSAVTQTHTSHSQITVLPLDKTAKYRTKQQHQQQQKKWENKTNGIYFKNAIEKSEANTQPHQDEAESTQTERAWLIQHYCTAAYSTSIDSAVWKRKRTASDVDVIICVVVVVSDVDVENDMFAGATRMKWQLRQKKNELCTP